jgi:hypothetical protein
MVVYWVELSSYGSVLGGVMCFECVYNVLIKLSSFVFNVVKRNVDHIAPTQCNRCAH